MEEPVISFKEAVIVNGETPVIYGLDMDVYPGDFVYIVGKVGTGKTSIIRTMIAENPLEKGFGTVCGYNLATIKDKEIPGLPVTYGQNRRRKLGICTQGHRMERWGCHLQENHRGPRQCRHDIQVS